MDKTEYGIRLKEINRLIEEQDYEGALVIADSIDWRKVKSVRTLCMVADIYETNGENEKSMHVLQLAYKNSTVRKPVLYQQIELSLKMGEYAQALKYYNKYLEIAGNDPEKYILKYRLYKAQEAPTEDLIEILEEYKEKDYTEKWAYELALLYKKNGDQNKCIETCDDLILWFGEGKYVMKAMELKMTYVPLTPEQKVLYDKKNKKEQTEKAEREEKEAVLQAEKTAALKADTQRIAGVSAAVMENLKKVSRTAYKVPEVVPEEILKEAAAASEPEKKTENVNLEVNTEELQERLAKSFEEVLSGINRARNAGTVDIIGSSAADQDISKAEEEDIKQYHVSSLEPEIINGGAISADREEAVTEKTEAPVIEEKMHVKKPEDSEITSVQEVDLEALFAETSSLFAEELKSAEEEVIREEVSHETEEAKRQEETSKISEEQPVLEESLEASEEEPEAEERTEEAEEGPETEESLEASEEEPEAEERTEEAEEGPETEESLEASEEEPEAEERTEEVEEGPETEESLETSEEEPEMEDSEFNDDELAKALEDTLKTLEINDVRTDEHTSSEFTKDNEMGNTKEITKDVLEEIERQCDEEERRSPSMGLVSETPEEKRNRILNSTRPDRLTDRQKALFSYFAKVPGMDEQILEAIDGVYRHADEKTSHRGNIAIMGNQGAGKTRLSEGLIKAICVEFGLEAAKFANLDAIDMNRKDPEAIIKKMAGGFLLIERASYMSSQTIEQLSNAMDFRTDSMILLIEDQKANMRKLLATYPEFSKKFESIISIPVFTNDELVTFARTYAKENGYKMDEMGILALYTLIGDNQRDDEPITVAHVKDMVDNAIQKASGKQFGRRLSKRRTDADGRILLYEKDFDLG